MHFYNIFYNYKLLKKYNIFLLNIMGNITNGGEVKSNLFGCSCGGEKNLCINPAPYSEIRVGETPDNNNIYLLNQNQDFNYFKTPDMRIGPNEFVRSYSLENKNKNIHQNNNINLNLNNFTNQLDNNFKEEDISKFDTEKFEKNPKILKLLALLGENSNFVLTEKESFYIKNIVSQNYLVQKLFHYKDDSYYLGFANKKNNKVLFGTYYFNDGSIYKGFFENDKINGRGRLIQINKYIYEGDFEDGLFNGFGKSYTLDNSRYEGNWKNDLQEGFGIEHYPDGSCYSGMFQRGKKHGKGKFLFKNGDIYEGDFNNEEMTGWGLYKRKDGKIYNGMVKNHLIEGIGIFIWNDNKRYIGEYHNELKDGFGIFYTNDGRNYAGFWKEGKQDGPGVVTNIYGQKYYVRFNMGEKITGKFFSMEEKDEIDKMILEGEKKINKDKLNKIAIDLILQREKEILIEKEKEKEKIQQKELENAKSEVSGDKNKNSNIKNSKNSLNSSHKIVHIKNNNTSTSFYNIKWYKRNSLTTNKNNKEKDEISNSIHFNAANSVYSDNGTLNNNFISNNFNSLHNDNHKNMIKIVSTKNNKDFIKININKSNKNSSSPNLILNNDYKKINNDKKEVEKSKSEIKTRDNSCGENYEKAQIINNNFV